MDTISTTLPGDRIVKKIEYFCSKHATVPSLAESAVTSRPATGGGWLLLFTQSLLSSCTLQQYGSTCAAHDSRVVYEYPVALRCAVLCCRRLPTNVARVRRP